MRRIPYALMLSLLVIASGCASTRERTVISPPGTPQITFAQVQAEPASFKGQPVTLGGKVLGARRLKEGTRIEILQLPLTSDSEPTMDLSKSQGRFVALQKEFLDPATIPPGTFVTIIGEVVGAITLPLDEIEYSYPLLQVMTVRVWADNELEEAPRIRPHIGPGPYWGPYWSPYWRPWPYYW